MKINLNVFISFTRTERRGIASLLLLLLFFIGIRMVLKYTTPRAQNADAENTLSDAWLAQHQKAAANISTADTLIDLNHADSAALLSLYGIGPALVHRILQRRNELGAFGNYTQLWQVYHFSKDTKEEILKKTYLRKDKK